MDVIFHPILLAALATIITATLLIIIAKRKGAALGRDVKLTDALKMYIPGRYPRQMIEDYIIDLKKAGILSPEKFMRNISLASFIVTIILATAVFLIGYLHPLKIPTSTIANPIPQNLRPYVYALVTFLFHPFVFTFLFLTVLNGKMVSRKENIDLNIHSLYIALLGFAKAKLPVKEAIREVMMLDLGEVSREFARIYYAVRYGNATLKAAMLEVASTTPSQKLAELLRGMVGVMEAGGDMARYIEDRINTMEVERKIIYTEYLKKLELVAEVYLTISIAIPTIVISLQLAKTVAGQSNLAAVYGMIYLFMPLTSAALVVILHGLSPEKGIERPGMNILAVIPVTAVLGIIIGLIRGNIEFWTLAFTIAGSVIAAAPLAKRVKEDEKLSSQLSQYFNRVLALVEAGKDLTTAFRMAAEETPLPLGRYVRAFAEMINKGVPRGKAFDWLFNATPSSDLKLAARIMSKTVDISGKVSQVLLSLVGELMRINAFRKERDASARTYGAIMVVAALIFLGIASAMSAMLLGELEKFGTATIHGAKIGKMTFAISPYIVERARTVLRHATYIVCTSAAVGIAAVRGDYRRLALPLAIMLTAALVAGILFMHLAP